MVSLHGRQAWPQLVQALATADTIAVFTDPQHTPDVVAGRLQNIGIHGVWIWVLEKMGYPEERVIRCRLSEAVDRRFQNPNLVVLERDPAAVDDGVARMRLGMPTEMFVHDSGLITKPEVRCVALAKLELAPDHTLWDLGAGSGSLAIEAALFITRGHIVGVEKNSRRAAMIAANRQRFGVANLEIVRAELPDGMTQLPSPDRVFVGGGGKHLAAVLDRAVEALPPNGIVVVNTVLMESLHNARQVLGDRGLATEVTQLQINRGHPMPWGERLVPDTPVWMVKGKKT